MIQHLVSTIHSCVVVIKFEVKLVLLLDKTQCIMQNLATAALIFMMMERALFILSLYFPPKSIASSTHNDFLHFRQNYVFHSFSTSRTRIRDNVDCHSLQLEIIFHIMPYNTNEFLTTLRAPSIRCNSNRGTFFSKSMTIFLLDI